MAGPARDGEARQLTRGGADAAPRWSPDGTQLAFVRSQDGPGQLWLLPAAGGEPEQLTTLPLGAGAAVWSPDGTKIAFTAPVDIEAAPGEDDDARQRRNGAPIVTERLDYQADGAGMLRTMRTHLHVLDLATKKCRQVTEGDWHAGEPAWSPDGTKLAFAAATAADADLTDHRTGLRARRRPTRRRRRSWSAWPTASPARSIWTADGAGLLVVGHPGAPVGHAGLLRVPLDGGAVTDLAAPLDRNVMPGGPGYPGALPVLVDDGRTVLFCARDRGCTHLYSVSARGRRAAAGARRRRSQRVGPVACTARPLRSC